LFVTIRQPTIADEEEIMSTMGFSTKKNVDLIQETMIIEKMEQRDASGKVLEKAETRSDVLLGYQSLPPKDKEKIFDEFKDKFGKYGIELKGGYLCGKCGADNDIEIDIVIQFFRMVGLS